MSAISAPREQIGALAEDELASGLSWLVNLRWLAAAGLLLMTWLVTDVWARPVPALPLYLLGFGLLAYNALAWWWLRRLNASIRPEVGGLPATSRRCRSASTGSCWRW